MARIRNPFTPTFGMVPPFLAGRDALLDTMSQAFERGLGDPNLCTLIIGPRGSGKTALLSCVGDEAREHGWIVVDAVAETGMLEDIYQHVSAAAAAFVEPAARRLSGVSIGEIIGVEWEDEVHEPLNWRMRMESLLSALSEKGVGLLVTVDEVRVNVEDMVRLASSYQLFVREGYQMALVMAGLPANVTDLVEDERVSFLRRARQRQLDTIGDADVERAFRKTVAQGGKTIGDEALALAVASSQGFPYMMQLVGYCVWMESDAREVITEEDVRLGVRAAQMDFKAGVLDRTWHEMSKGDRAFARAMLPDTNGSTLSAVALRMGRSTGYASTYRKRLMRQGVIASLPGGSFDFIIPLMRTYIEELG